jgi:hypothetical protein
MNLDSLAFSDFKFLSIAFLVLAFSCFVWLYLIYRIRKKHGFERSTSMILFNVSVPKDDEKEKESQGGEKEKEMVSITEQLLLSISKMADNPFREIIFGKPQFSLEVANPFDDEAIYFYIACPKKFATTVEKQIYGFFPKAEVNRAVNDYNIFTPNGFSKGVYLTLKRKSYLPIRTYKNMEADSLNNITNALSKLRKVEEGAAIQIMIRKSPASWSSKARQIVRRMKQGESYHRAKAGEVSRTLNSFMKMPDPFISKENQQMQGQGRDEMNLYQTPQKELRQLTPGEEDFLKLVEEKTMKPSFEVNIRVLASSDSKERTEELLQHLTSVFSQFDTVEMNSFLVKNPLLKKDLIFNFSFRNFIKRFKIVLNIEELASLFHFPIFSTQTPKLETVKAKTASAPPNMPDSGTLIGKNVYRETETKVFLQREDRRRHLYTIGQTGTGKSTFLSEMARQDIENGEGVCIVDPHGELVEDLLKYVPKERIEDVILFDPADVGRPMGMNLLEYDQPEQKTFVINEMISIFDKLYDLKQTGGPMFEQYMRNAMLLVMSHPESGSTLMEISKVLSDAEFRKMKLDNCDNQVVVDFWTKEAEKAGGEAALANMVPYITSKLTTFVTNDIMRPIISQQKSAFNFREAMDTKKIVLVNLSKGKIGEINANLLGMVIVGKILMSAMARVDMPQDKREDFYLYIDEFQNFTTDSIASILSEARKYKLNLIIAHQFIQQVEEKIRDAVFGNVGSMVCFRIGATDAEYMVKQFGPTFSEHDLINVDNYRGFAKIMINNVVSPPFSMRTYPPKEVEVDFTDNIRQYSRTRYGRERADIEAELQERLNLLKTDPEDMPMGSDDFDSDMSFK